MITLDYNVVPTPSGEVSRLKDLPKNVYLSLSDLGSWLLIRTWLCQLWGLLACI